MLTPEIRDAIFDRIDKLPKPYNILVRIRFEEILEKSKKHPKYLDQLRKQSGSGARMGSVKAIETTSNAHLINDLFNWAYTTEGSNFWASIYNWMAYGYTPQQILIDSQRAIDAYLVLQMKRNVRQIVPVQQPEILL